MDSTRAAPIRLENKIIAQINGLTVVTIEKRAKQIIRIVNPVVRISRSQCFLSAKIPAGVSNKTKGKSMKEKIMPMVPQPMPKL